MTTRRAVLAGATGLVGGRCLSLLCASSAYARVTVPVRRPMAPPHAKVRVLEVDLRNLELLGDTLTCDDVYCCLGTTMRQAGSRDAFRSVDFELPLALARSTRAAGARRFLLVSSLGANPGARNFYLRVKGETEAALAQIGFETLLLFRPSFLLGRREDRRSGEIVAGMLGSIVAPLLRGPLRRYQPVPADVVARAMVRAALGDYRGRHVFQSEQIVEIGRDSASV